MITKNDDSAVADIRNYLNKQSEIGETGVDWEKVHWIETLDRIVSNLKIASESYKYCSKEDKDKNFYTAQCECGWWGSSRLLNGGGQIADTGDHFECTCPVCGSPDIFDEKEEDKLNVAPLTQEEFDEMWDEVKDDAKVICGGMAQKEIFRAGTIWYYHHLLNKKLEADKN